MSDQYRLVYAGEVLEGQHAAVVKKRLQGLLKLDEERMDVLFSGKAVVVKKTADKQTAARYQDAFKKAGARLRVQPVDAQVGDNSAGVNSPVAVASASATVTETAETVPASGQDTTTGLSVRPSGSDVLEPQERTTVEPLEVDTDHLKVQGAVFAVDEPEIAVDTPNVDHLSVAEIGAVLGAEGVEQVEDISLELDVEFDLADVGALLREEQVQPEAVIDVSAVDFEVAETGAQIGTPNDVPPVAAPDTSHLELDDDKR